jgi:hypothetical protein
MTTTQTPSERIVAEATAWPGVTAADGKRGELSLRVHGREIGHLHGDRTAHFFFAPDVWDELHRAQRITHHPVFPDRRGPAARTIVDERDVDDVIALLRLNYERKTTAQAA